jgi:hypothetical protein
VGVLDRRVQGMRGVIVVVVGAGGGHGVGHDRDGTSDVSTTDTGLRIWQGPAKYYLTHRI